MHVETRRDVETGEQGELLIRGPQVMKGYLNNPGATALAIDRDGWLQTGDVGCVDADGSLWIVDRLKEFIKYKGFQVAPAELEGVLLTHPAVADSAVIGVADEEAGEVPKAFVVAAGPSPRPAHPVRRRSRGAVQEAALGRVRRRDPEVTLGQDLATRADHRERERTAALSAERS